MRRKFSAFFILLPALLLVLVIYFVFLGGGEKIKNLNQGEIETSAEEYSPTPTPFQPVQGQEDKYDFWGIENIGGQAIFFLPVLLAIIIFIRVLIGGQIEVPGKNE